MTQVVENLKRKYQHKKILIVGLGLQGGGAGLAKFFAELGAYVHVTDKKPKEALIPSLKVLEHLPVSYTLGNHKLSDFLQADVIFKGPSVPWNLPEIIEAQKRHVPVEMESSFFASHCPAKIIGVTGTRGKSTTSAMIYHVMKKHTMPVYLAGNIPGVSTISLLHHVTESDWVILELSSWQLSGFHRKKISPHIGILTNIYPDHLNYYETMDEYIYDKKAVYAYQEEDDYLVVNNSLRKMVENDNPKSSVIFFENTSNHIEENKSAAREVIKITGCNAESFDRDICDFAGLPYRLQKISCQGKHSGIIFINDSASTTPTSTEKAIDSFPGSSIILILGGNSKKLPWDTLMKKLKAVKQVVLLKGSFTDEILPELQQHYADTITKVFDNLECAVGKAYETAKTQKEKTVILFSPAATSFAMFQNEFHRGEEFDKIIKGLF